MAERTARAFWIERPGHGALRRESLPDPGPDAVVVRTRFSGISRGTESLVFQGRVPPTQYQAMRAPFQVGDFPAPVKYGYSSVGVVEVVAAHCAYPSLVSIFLVPRPSSLFHSDSPGTVSRYGSSTPLPLQTSSTRTMLA